ncbi:hypothetical protein PYH66_10210 [Staphylococcus delphini]|uniref:hypothetical protein n=1 Tax=Staphylococcus delphini TaxID=53344 RepID=UPI00336520D1
MKSTNIILNLLPTELQKMLENKDTENVLTYFMSNDISDEKLAFYLSNLANQINTIEYHEMVANKVLEKDPKNDIAMKYVKS